MAEAMAEIRRQLEPDETDPDRILMLCRDCGATYPARRRSNASYCADCGARRQVEAADSLEARDGPVYRRAVAGQLRHWLAEAARLGITPDLPRQPGDGV